MHIPITGEVNFIGSHLVGELVRDGYRVRVVRVVDNLSSGRIESIRHHPKSNGIS
jgi:UDP-glucose 4-epimerase